MSDEPTDHKLLLLCSPTTNPQDKVILSFHFSFHCYFKLAGSDAGQCLGSRHGLCMVSKQANHLCRA